MAPICRQVWDRAVESSSGGDVMEDAALAAHVGSCMTCFRTLAELRDAPRVAAALRADAPAVPVSDRFWDDLAARTTAAASAALAGPRKRRAWRRDGRRRRSWRRPPPRGCWSRATRPSVRRRGCAGRGRGRPRPAYDDESAEEAVDVADLDEPALRQLLAAVARARARARRRARRDGRRRRTWRTARSTMT